jgi:hypothetical protein
MTATVRSRTCASAATMDRPAGATSSQCRPEIAALVLRDAPVHVGLRVGDVQRVVGERERRDLQTVITQRGGDGALLLEGQRLQHFIA